MYGNVFQPQTNTSIDEMFYKKVDVCNLMSSFDSMNLMQ